jgi:lysophospholipid acyltransferase (LPLAT)-like uncharacterized protein
VPDDPNAEPWRQSLLRRAQVAVIGAVAYRLVALLGTTLRWKVEGVEHYEAAVRSGQAPILGFWHGRILPATVYFRGRGIVVITSRNFDGEWIARIIERFGYGTARGSTTRGGPQALRGLVRALRRGAPAGFTLDGPRGPARVAQPGALWLASATGHPVLPFHLEASRAWTAKSWDATQVPRPFATVAIAMGEPLTVPAGADDDMIRAATADLEARLVRLEARARAMLTEGARHE